jgi:hypothetical protein
MITAGDRTVSTAPAPVHRGAVGAARSARLAASVVGPLVAVTAGAALRLLGRRPRQLLSPGGLSPHAPLPYALDHHRIRLRPALAGARG